jgi:molybdopterin converting factor small subunit
MTEVHLDSMLSQFVPRRNLSSSARTVGALLDELETQFPRLRHRLRDETETVRPFVKIFVNGKEVRLREDGGPRLGPKDEVDILHSIQGG